MSNQVDTTTMVNIEGGRLFITIPSEVIQKLKVSNLIGKSSTSIEVKCIASYFPKTVDDKDDLF